MVAGVCSVDGCDKYGDLHKGMCRKHYIRVNRYGSTEGRTETIGGIPRCKPDMTLAERIEHIGYTVTPRGCHEWNGHKHDAGYPMINWKRTRTYIHRAVLEMKLGRKIGPDMCACHTCDNPPCMNPAHLFEGTKADNNMDKVRKNRAKGGKVGNRTPRHDKAAFEMAAEMRAAGATYREISEETGISISYLSSLNTGARKLPINYRKAA